MGKQIEMCWRQKQGLQQLSYSSASRAPFGGILPVCLWRTALFICSIAQHRKKLNWYLFCICILLWRAWKEGSLFVQTNQGEKFNGLNISPFLADSSFWSPDPKSAKSDKVPSCPIISPRCRNNMACLCPKEIQSKGLPHATFSADAHHRSTVKGFFRFSKLNGVYQVEVVEKCCIQFLSRWWKVRNLKIKAWKAKLMKSCFSGIENKPNRHTRSLTASCTITQELIISGCPCLPSPCKIPVCILTRDLQKSLLEWGYKICLQKTQEEG